MMLHFLLIHRLISWTPLILPKMPRFQMRIFTLVELMRAVISICLQPYLRNFHFLNLLSPQKRLIYWYLMPQILYCSLRSVKICTMRWRRMRFYTRLTDKNTILTGKLESQWINSLGSILRVQWGRIEVWLSDRLNLLSLRNFLILEYSVLLMNYLT